MAEGFEDGTFSRADCLVVDAEVALSRDEPDFEGGAVRAIAERLGVDLVVSNDAAVFARPQTRLADLRRGDGLAWTSSNTGYKYCVIDTASTPGYLTAG